MELTFGLILSIVIAVYLAIDAPKHGKNPWLWGILGFIFGPLVLGIYLIKTGRKLLGWIIVGIAILFFLLIVILVVVGGALLFSAI